MVVIREAEVGDLEKILDLLLRLKRLNSEFDPLFKVRDDALDRAREYLRRAINNRDSHLVLVAEDKGRVVGMLKADLRDRLFYEPAIEGAIVDFYVMPEYRRKGLGKEMLDRAAELLRGRGAQIITAEFPSLNQIAVNFYVKRGFRPLLSVYAKET